MDLHHLINSLLGLQDLNIINAKLSEDFNTCSLEVELPWNKALCSKCEHPLLEFHQWRERKLKAPSMGIFKDVILKLKYPRGLCPVCNKIQRSKIVGIHSYFRSHICSFVESAGRLMEETTCAAAARILHSDPKVLWNMDQWRMREMKKHLDSSKFTENLSLSKMSADEVHFRTESETKRDHPFAPRWTTKFITNLVCTKEAKVIANAAGRDAMALANCLKVLSKPQRLSVEFFAIDMNPGYFRAVSKFCPNAEIAVDRFHLVQNLNEYFDQVRKEEFHKAKKQKKDFEEIMLSPSRRFMFLERNAVLSIEEQNMLGKLKILNTNISNAMIIVEYFHKVLEEKGVFGFRQRLAKWYGLVRESKLLPLRKFALQIRKYRINIEAYIRSNLTTAISEGLNNKIRVLKAMAYSYTNEESFMLKILQRCGFLNSRSMDTRALFKYSGLA
jgi:transposase